MGEKGEMCEVGKTYDALQIITQDFSIDASEFRVVADEFQAAKKLTRCQ